MNRSKYVSFILAVATVAFICSVTLGAAAQDVTHPSTTRTVGPTEEVRQITIKNAEVVHVSGHDMVVELENGKFELLSLPKDFKFHVDGKDLSIHQLTPGTKISQEVHTVRTPEEVTTLRTVNGKVWHLSGRHVILAFPDGQHKRYTVRDGIVFNINGEEKTVYDLRKGMEISATVITVVPQQTVTTHMIATGQAPPPPNVPFEGPLLIEPVAKEPVVTAAVEEPAPQELPRTGSFVPLTGALGLFLLAAFISLKIIRRKAA